MVRGPWDCMRKAINRCGLKSLRHAYVSNGLIEEK